jgi:YesN/AraC family two-component response regulator
LENELMEAVAKGQIHKADLLFSGFSTFSMEQRVSDPVRNIKNYCIIMNTLLRKAAEKGNVHPVHIDSTSSEFALKIEQLHSMDMAASLMTKMAQTYCRLVRQHAIKGYSPPVQKTVVYIDAHLSDNLTLSTLADTLSISSSYLSTLFKKETGQTLTAYINTRRIRQAKHLLETTKLQIQTVAQHCGIMDVQYFSKLFKNMVGVSPKRYRQTLRR